jgi:calpain
MQKYTRQKRAAAQVEATEEFIQFRVYKIRNARRSGGSVDSSDLERVGASGSYTNKREVNSRFALSVGTYVIVPSCYDEDVEGEFLIRIFTEKPLTTK